MIKREKPSPTKVQYLRTHPQALLSPSSSHRQEAILAGCRREKYFNIFSQGLFQGLLRGLFQAIFRRQRLLVTPEKIKYLNIFLLVFLRFLSHKAVLAGCHREKYFNIFLLVFSEYSACRLSQREILQHLSLDPCGVFLRRQYLQAASGRNTLTFSFTV